MEVTASVINLYIGLTLHHKRLDNRRELNSAEGHILRENLFKNLSQRIADFDCIGSLDILTEIHSVLILILAMRTRASRIRALFVVPWDVVVAIIAVVVSAVANIALKLVEKS